MVIVALASLSGSRPCVEMTFLYDVSVCIALSIHPGPLKIVLNNTFAGSFSGSDKLKNVDHVVSTVYRLDLSV